MWRISGYVKRRVLNLLSAALYELTIYFWPFLKREMQSLLKEMWRWGSSWLTNMHSWASTAWPYPPESCFKCDFIEWASLVLEHITQGSNTASSHIKALTLLTVHGTILECSEFSNAEVFQVVQVQLGQSHHHPVVYAPVRLAGDVPFFSLERCSWQPGQPPEEIWILLFPLVPAQGKH